MARVLAYKEGAKVSLVSRNAIDRTSQYQEIGSAVREVKSSTLALDGEIVVFDSKNVSRFQLLQQGKGRPRYAIFDCLYAEGVDLRNKTLGETSRDAGRRSSERIRRVRRGDF
jgi:ATP-dependent DNA ligase